MDKLFNLLKSLKIPVAFTKFDEPVSLPFIVYRQIKANFYGSDFENHIANEFYSVELYTDKKDLLLEKNLDKLLSFTEFEKDTLYLNSEKMYETVYTFEITKKLD